MRASPDDAVLHNARRILSLTLNAWSIDPIMSNAEFQQGMSVTVLADGRRGEIVKLRQKDDASLVYGVRLEAGKIEWYTADELAPGPATSLPPEITGKPT